MIQVNVGELSCEINYLSFSFSLSLFLMKELLMWIMIWAQLNKYLIFKKLIFQTYVEKCYKCFKL